MSIKNLTLQKFKFLIYTAAFCIFIVLEAPIYYYFLNKYQSEKNSFEQDTNVFEYTSLELFNRAKFSLAQTSEFLKSHDFKVSPQEFESYAIENNYFTHIVGVLGVGFIRYIPMQDTTKYEKDFNTKFLNFAIHHVKSDFAIQDAYENFHLNDEFVIELIEPKAQNLKAIGLNIASEEFRRSASIKSAFNNNTQVTRPIKLVQIKDPNDWGFLVVQPVFRSHKKSTHELHQKEDLVGWVYTPISSNDILKVSNMLNDFEINYSITDTESNIEFSSSHALKDSSYIFKHSDEISVLGQKWKIQTSRPLVINNTEIFISILLSLFFITLCYTVASYTIRYQVITNRNLEFSKTLNQVLLENSQFPIFILNLKDQKLIEANSFAQFFFGLNKQFQQNDTLEKVLLQSRHKFDSDNIHQLQEKISSLKQHSYLDFDWNLTTKAKITYHFKINLIKSTRESQDFVFILMQDVTEIRNLQSDLKTQLSYTNTILNSTDYSIISTNLNGIITSFNFGAEKLLGYKALEMIGQKTPAIIHDLDEVVQRSKELSEELQTQIAPGFDVFITKAQMMGTETRRWKYVHKNKSIIPVSLTVSCLYDDDMRLVGYLGIARNLTQEIKLEHQLSQFKLALDHSAIISEADPSGKITAVNKKFCDITGYKEDELIGQDHRIVNSGFHKKEFIKEFWDTIQNGKTWSGQFKNKAKDGSYYWVQSVMTPIMDQNNKIEKFISIRFDITNSKDQELQLLSQAKFASLGQMAAGIAHEINNPLAVISGNAQMMTTLLEDTEIDRAVFKKCLERIENMTTRSTKIIKGLKTFSHSSTTKIIFEKIKVSNLIADLQNFISTRIIKEKIDFEVILKSDLELECGANQMTQVLLNLLQNSMDAIENLDKKWIKLEITDLQENIKFEITDSGSGIDTSTAQKMMDPFYTTKIIGKGTGLGLSISKGIVEDHGGRLYYDENSKNTKFVFLVPKVHIQKNKLVA